MSFIQDGVLGPGSLAELGVLAIRSIASEFVAASDGHGGTLITFTSATSTSGGHGNAIATSVTS
jgi:hypothetical protein